ncbi:MAG TPA: serine/threonine-protein kinase [Methylovirgula sp.]|nr:serine/threonine-protein kinase [Methylovirgula sp.]
MSETTASLDQAFHDLDANVRAEEIIARLRDLESSCTDPRDRARLLHARGLALNRLGFDALDDLRTAADIFERLEDRPALAETWRAIALVHNWRANAREASLALLRTIAEANDDRPSLARAMLETGRLGIEIGRPEEAYRFLARGLAIGATELKPLETCKARVNALQALVAVGETEKAESALAEIDPNFATPRLRHLALLERARIALAKGRIEDAEQTLAEARALLPADDSENFSWIEQAHAEAEAHFAKKDYAAALERIGKVIARYFADDLPGREVGARILQAKSLDQLGRREEADATLAAALQQAIERQLSSYRGMVLEQFAASGRTPGAWMPGAAPAITTANSKDLYYGRETLGGGGFGSVESAYDAQNGSKVALKHLRLEAIYDVAEQADRLHAAEMEVAAASRVRHPGVGRVFGLLREPNGEALLVREFIEGKTLRDAISQSKLDFSEKLALLANLSFALAAIHAGSVVHRDLKPENVILRDNRAEAPVIIDFGISAIGRVWQGKDAARTLVYSAPEQTKAGWADARSDLYSLGLIAYEILAGRLPEAPEPGLLGIVSGARRSKAVAQELGSLRVPPAIAALVTRLLAVSPQYRPSSAQDVATAFAAAKREI